MEDPSHIKLTITIVDPNLDTEDREREVQRLLDEMLSLDEIERVDRTLDPNLREESRSLVGLLPGALTAVVSPERAKDVFAFLNGALFNRIIEVKVEANGKKFEAKVSNQKDLDKALEAATKFVEFAAKV